jgi:SAM-dependent methyltransferase
MTNNDDRQPYQSPGYWDGLADSFDDEPDHGLRDPMTRAAWTELLVDWLPPGRLSILDVGCGTGSLSLLIAGLGHQVTGIDWSPSMIVQAEAKAKELNASAGFRVEDAADPRPAPTPYDMILCRHVLWAMPKQAEVLRRWAGLLAPGGRILLIEGYWHTGGGLHAEEIVAALPPALTNVEVIDLSGKPLLWGAEVIDERYMVTAQLPN